MLFHDGYVQGVARRHLWTSHEDVLRAICSGGIHGEHLIDNSPSKASNADWMAARRLIAT